MDRPAAGEALFTALLVLLATALVVAPMIAVGPAGRAGIEAVVVLSMLSVVWKLRPHAFLLVLSVLTASLTQAASIARVFSSLRAWVVLDPK